MLSSLHICAHVNPPMALVLDESCRIHLRKLSQRPGRPNIDSLHWNVTSDKG